MMEEKRDIYFRFWHKRLKRMSEPYGLGMIHRSLCVEFGEAGMILWNEIIPLQFIGRVDKNKVLIFDGDIIRINQECLYGYRQGQIEVVWWNDCGWTPFADNQDGMLYPNPNLCEVIGNEYENPDLSPYTKEGEDNAR